MKVAAVPSFLRKNACDSKESVCHDSNVNQATYTQQLQLDSEHQRDSLLHSTAVPVSPVHCIIRL